MIIRPEHAEDAAAISALTEAAFTPMPYSNGAEVAVIEHLRADGDLTLSLVTEMEGLIVAHIAFSPITINGAHEDWFGLGPVSVDPKRQGKGLGTALINEGLTQIKRRGAKGCALIGNPDYYSRFGFKSLLGFVYGDLDTKFVQQFSFTGHDRLGRLEYAPAFAKASR